MSLDPGSAYLAQLLGTQHVPSQKENLYKPYRPGPRRRSVILDDLQPQSIDASLQQHTTSLQQPYRPGPRRRSVILNDLQPQSIDASLQHQLERDLLDSANKGPIVMQGILFSLQTLVQERARVETKYLDYASKLLNELAQVAGTPTSGIGSSLSGPIAEPKTELTGEKSSKPTAASLNTLQYKASSLPPMGSYCSDLKPEQPTHESNPRHVPETEIESWKQLYDIMDEDNNGSLDKHEVVKFVGAIGIGGENQVLGLFEKYDADKNGTLELDEFLNMMTELYWDTQPSKAEVIGRDKQERLKWTAEFQLVDGEA
jgi:Ca2+-binding EF-hand superfamily protein